MLEMLGARNLRLPNPVPLSEPYDRETFHNHTGFSIQIMLDLQRIIAALHVKDKPQKVDAKHLVVASKLKHSNKLVMAMSSQSEWRREVTLWLAQQI